MIRRAWIDGEDEAIHEKYIFDKQPRRFLSVVSEHVDALVFRDVPAIPEAYFIRWGLGEEWSKKGESRVFVVLAIPLAQLSHERTIFKFISDFEPGPWTYGRTNIELRAWARLLFVNKGFQCNGRETSYFTGEKLWANALFLPELIGDRNELRKVDWHPEDYALYPGESQIAKETHTLPQVIEFLRSHQLPWEETSLRPKRG